MKRMAKLVVAAVTTMTIATAPPSPKNHPLEPAGKWVVNGEEGLCVLSRVYRVGDGEIEVGFRPLGSEERTEIILVAKGSGRTPQIGTGAVRLDHGARIAAPYLSQSFDKPHKRFVTLTVERNLTADLASTQALTVEAGTTTGTFHLVNTAAALKTLGRCEDLMLTNWGVDPVAYHGERSHPKMKGSTAFGPDQYPQAALRIGAQGRAVGLLKVGEQGQVDDCRITVSAGNADLDRATCSIAIHRLRFTPARGADGRPAVSSYVLPVRWGL